MKYDVRLVQLLGSISFDAAKALQAPLVARHDAASTAIQAFTKDVPRGPMGLLPDAVSQSPAYRALRGEYAAANDALLRFNGPFFRQFKKELRIEREARRAVRYGTVAA
jgi:hypothetical protein